MRIVKHKLCEELAIRLLGWKWMAFDGRPTKSHHDYPKECRVRQLLSAKQLKNDRWQEFLSSHNGSEASGDEPLAYTYCSSGSSVAVLPKITIMVDDE